MSEKAVREIRRGVPPHWVGDGFPVRSLFSYQDDPRAFSPFLLLDYAAPTDFPPAESPRGVGEHPHRGFETVTIVYQGEVEHRDSAGNHGTIGPGDVQWMTAASGVVHEEFHSRAFTSAGGTFEVVQLWVNLPAALKMSPPRYQGILAAEIPTVPMAGDAGTARVIAGELDGAKGPARTFTPVGLFDLSLAAGFADDIAVHDGQTAILLVRRGAVVLGDESVGPGELALFDRDGDSISLSAPGGAEALLITGEPIDEPVVGRGPFVMNTADEIRQAMVDYQTSRMGHLG